MNAIIGLLLTVFATGFVVDDALDVEARHSIKASGGFVALSVPDAEASARWYQDMLGLRVSARPPAGPGVRVIVLEGRGWTIELLQRSDARPLSAVAPSISSRDQIHGIYKTGVIVNDFDKTLAFLQSRGVPIAFGPYPARPDQKANVIIRDPDGNLIQFLGK